MRWKPPLPPPGPLRGQRRFKKRFAWFPTRMDWERTVVWLESYVAEQSWDPRYGWQTWERMTMEKFVDRVALEVRNAQYRRQFRPLMYDPNRVPYNPVESGWTDPMLLEWAMDKMDGDEA